MKLMNYRKRFVYKLYFTVGDRSKIHFGRDENGTKTAECRLPYTARRLISKIKPGLNAIFFGYRPRMRATVQNRRERVEECGPVL